MAAPGRKAGGLYGGINLSSTTTAPTPIIEAAPVLVAAADALAEEKTTKELDESKPTAGTNQEPQERRS